MTHAGINHRVGFSPPSSPEKSKPPDECRARTPARRRLDRAVVRVDRHLSAKLKGKPRSKCETELRTGEQHARMRIVELRAVELVEILVLAGKIELQRYRAIVLEHEIASARQRPLQIVAES